MEISIDLYRRRRSTRFEANVAFRASVGRGDFTIGGDFTSVAVGSRCEVAADGEVAAADRGAKRNVRLEACRTAAPVQVNADFHGILEAADRCPRVLSEP